MTGSETEVLPVPDNQRYRSPGSGGNRRGRKEGRVNLYPPVRARTGSLHRSRRTHTQGSDDVPDQGRRPRMARPAPVRDHQRQVEASRQRQHRDVPQVRHDVARRPRSETTHPVPLHPPARAATLPPVRRHASGADHTRRRADLAQRDGRRRANPARPLLRPPPLDPRHRRAGRLDSSANPCHIRGAGTAKRVHKIQPLTLQELATLVDEMPERYKLMTLLAAWCGLRFGLLTQLLTPGHRRHERRHPRAPRRDSCLRDVRRRDPEASMLAGVTWRYRRT